MDMLSSRLPVNTSLTRLGVPKSGTRSARERPCFDIKDHSAALENACLVMNLIRTPNYLIRSRRIGR